ncbi:protein phosphatase methylesterase 1 (S33 family) [Schistosoma mansoni]|uniref:protein phosphatase methylesterase 1 (S33 family) n=1 Tax=Schistosoma mansoni TaxID=6183 RepID=UPI00022DC22F|nr:protein phosphatase methylesterase 1 (S33 family) [Schistosoma mansoni]|eukprot:XP_018651695.1 protein phosphatase methylesterase 1 (S33 family) [Schistosoma mansoni]
MSSVSSVLPSDGKCKEQLNSERNGESYDPVKWSEYFNIRDDIELEGGTFRIYRRGVEGPLLFFLHGGGFSALTWAVLSSLITDQVKCQCLAVDMRGHGDTKCTNDDDLSIDTLSKDIIKIIFAMYPMEAPPIILVGHSMGGAVAVHVACKRTIPSLAGLVVIDVVEGSALSSLRGMTAFLRSRPQSFFSLPQAIEWSVRSSQIRNVNSARVSFPGQLKRITTVNSSKFSSQSTGESIHSISGSTLPSFTTSSTISKHSDLVTCQSNCPQYTWRIDLIKTQPFWKEWFSGLSKLFLSIPEPKLLLLADADRLDKDLTIGQMQGKFQVQLFPRAGHAVQEDTPDRVLLLLYKMKNLLTTRSTNLSIFLTAKHGISLHTQSNALYANKSGHLFRRLMNVQYVEQLEPKLPGPIYALVKLWFKIRPLKAELADLRRRIQRNKEGFEVRPYIFVINIIQRGFCGEFSIFTVEIMSQLKLDHHRKPGSTGRPFRPIMGLLSSAHPRTRSRERDSNPGPTSLEPKPLTDRPLSWHPTVLMSNFNQSTILSDRSPVVFSEMISLQQTW